MFKRLINKLTNNKEENEINEGTVKFFNRAKGFGFIEMENSDQDVFVHASNLIDKIRENDRVQFDIEQEEKGPSAVNVKLL
ncbi:MAG TPA: cold shock domain-containing protein [Flavobacteriaceae bacterium]|nr:cold shock domain-containing protein [Flavobacteriaceae bacterium]